MTRRTRGREIALQVLYQLELNAGQSPEEVTRFIERRRLLAEPKLCVFSQSPWSTASAKIRRGSTR